MLIQARESWTATFPNDRTVWHRDTSAEARPLLQEWDQAAREYSVAVENSRNAPRDIESMGRQAFRILMGWHTIAPCPSHSLNSTICSPVCPRWNLGVPARVAGLRISGTAVTLQTTPLNAPPGERP